MIIPKILHYTALKKGDQYIMASGKVAHLIGTEILGTASFLFKYYTKGIDDDLLLIYPGVPGCRDHPIMNFNEITTKVDNELKILRKQKIQDAVDQVFLMFEPNEALKQYINYRKDQ